MSEEAKVDYLFKGLKPTLLEKMWVVNPATTQEFLASLKLHTEALEVAARPDWVVSMLGPDGRRPPPKEERKDDLRDLVLELKAEIEEMRRTSKSSRPWAGKDKPKPSRTTDGKPICHRCGKAGHIARVCRTDLKQENKKPDVPKGDERRSVKRDERKVPRNEQQDDPASVGIVSTDEEEDKESTIHIIQPAKLITEDVVCQGMELKAVIDTGAVVSVVSPSLREKLQAKWVSCKVPSVVTASGQKVLPMGAIEIEVEHRGMKAKGKVIVLAMKNIELLLGNDFLKQFNRLEINYDGNGPDLMLGRIPINIIGKEEVTSTQKLITKTGKMLPPRTIVSVEIEPASLQESTGMIEPSEHLARVKGVTSGKVLVSTVQPLEQVLMVNLNNHQTYIQEGTSGYWQIPMHKEHKAETAFVTPDGLYQFLVMPFGLASAPGTFQRMMDLVLSGLRWTICLVYLDDIIIYAGSANEHLVRIRQVLTALHNAGLKIKLVKCQFAAQEVKALGHVISGEGIRPDPEKLKAIENFPSPSSLRKPAEQLKCVRSFIGLSKPLTDMFKKGGSFVWEVPQEESFKTLKQALVKATTLAYPDFTKPFEIHPDAYDYGLGSVLLQRVDNVERPLAYASRLLAKSENNYSITEKECLALVWAVKKFRSYIWGMETIVVTDHRALCWLLSKKDLAGRLARWSLQLQEFLLRIVHRNGRLHTDADALSRYPVNVVTSSDEGLTYILAALSIDQDTKKEFQLAQQEEWSEVFAAIKKGKVSGRYRIKDDLLFYEKIVDDGRLLKLCVPQSFKEEVMRSCHHDITAGHLGLTRTLAKVRARYHWWATAEDVSEFVRSCRECQSRKPVYQRPAGFMEVKRTERPFERLGLDILGPFPLSKKGNKQIIVAVDYSLPFVTFAYNTTRHETTEKTPFYLVYGREAVLPIDVTLNADPNPIPPENCYSSEWAIQRLQQARLEVQARAAAVQQKQKEIYDENRIAATMYLPNEEVLVYKPIRKVGKSEKLLHRWFGPYTVVRQTTQSNYELRLGKSPKTEIVHVERMKPFIDMTSVARGTKSPVPSEDLHENQNKGPEKEASANAQDQEQSEEADTRPSEESGAQSETSETNTDVPTVSPTRQGRQGTL
ncbi:pol polyprotein [Daphnia sinensis]|uniref:RNA-directed DNA polymerase n=1 Tax=Daphnia sinensis TaxID=1820382 RepID=A0AAD5L4X6_9CRUS|nr:pol polyprotein [Daphnia sinensis]